MARVGSSDTEGSRRTPSVFVPPTSMPMRRVGGRLDIVNLWLSRRVRDDFIAQVVCVRALCLAAARPRATNHLSCKGSLIEAARSP